MRCADGRWVYARRFVLFCTRFVYLISCRDPRPPRQRPSRPNTKRPTVRCSKTLLCAYFVLQPAAISQQPPATSQQRLPRSAPATPTAVTPQRPTVERQTTVVAALASAVWLCHSESIFCSCRFILAHVSSTASVAAIRGRNVNGRTDRTPNDRTQYPRQLWFSVRAVRRLPVHTGYPIRLPRRGRPSDFTS